MLASFNAATLALISKNVVAVQSNKRQAKTEMNAGFIPVMY